MIVYYFFILLAVLINFGFAILSVESLTFTILASICGCFLFPDRFLYKEIVQFRLLYKKIIVYSAIKEFYQDVIYKPTEGFPKERIDKLNIINMINSKYESSDYIKAKFN